MTTELNNNEHALLAREVAADRAGYTAESMSSWRLAFMKGWEACWREVGLMVQTPGGDGCYCAHHPDDPAHTKDCYDLFKALMGR